MINVYRLRIVRLGNLPAPPQHMRVPVARLVDWMDQAVLLIHLPDGDDSARGALQRLGIRTATDLEAAWAEVTPTGRTMLSRAAVGPDATQIHGAAFVGALGRAANIEHIRAFRSHDWLEESEPLRAGSVS